MSRRSGMPGMGCSEPVKIQLLHGKEHVVDIDLSKFFDRINHDRLTEQVRRRIDDKRILRLPSVMIFPGSMMISAKSIERAMEKVKELTPRRR